ncbi:MAG: signal peptidase I [Oligoflexales bacterium]
MSSHSNEEDKSIESKNHPQQDHFEITEEKPGFFSYENLKSLSILILAVLAFRSSIMSPYVVPTPSMEPTIKVGDRLLAFKLSYNLRVPFTEIALASWGGPERGDIIVFPFPQDKSIDYVKRVVGVAGDTIKIRNDIVYINGTAQEQQDHNFDRTILDDIDEDKTLVRLFKENLSGLHHWVIRKHPFAQHAASGDWGHKQWIVPHGHVFVMGDNRHNSYDSRFWGMVPVSSVRGKALFVLWSHYFPGESWLDFKFRFNRFGGWLDSM